MWSRLTLALLTVLAACSAAPPPASAPAPPGAPAPPAAPAAPSAAPVAPVAETPEAQARGFLDGVAHRRFEEAARRFDAELAQAMSPVELAALWRTLEEASGAFQAVEGAETDVEGDYRVVRVTCRFARLRKVVRVVLGEEDRIAGLFYGPVPRELEDASRAVLDRLSRGDYAGASAGFDTVMRGSLPPEKLAAVWKQVVRKSGPFAEVRRASVVPAGMVWGVLLECRFGGAEVVVKIAYDVRDQIAGLFFLPGDALAPWKAPAYVQPDRFTERDVTVGTSPALPGTLTLTLPRGAGPFPAVVLVHGSGPSDADASQGPSKIFKDLAWGLGSRGVAVLRYVKRTRQAPGGVASVKEEVLDGAEAAVDLALHTREIDPRRVVVVGHSQGGYLAPRLAAETPAVAALVLLAGPSRPLQDSLLDQLTYLQKLDPGSEEKKRLVEAARAFKRKIEDPALRPEEAVDLPGGAAEEGRYFLALRGYRPTEVAAGLSIPILVLQGDRDYQVTTPDFEGWRRALGGRPNVELKRYPGLNHLFIAGTRAPRPAEYETPGHVDAQVVNDLAAFVGRL
jgi:hypothetical protein